MTADAAHDPRPGRGRRAAWLLLALGTSTLIACEPTPSPVPPPTTSTTTSTTVPSTTAPGRAVGYYSSWSIYERDVQVASIPAERLTHLSYAFATIANGGCAVGDRYADIDKAFPGDPSSAPFKGNFRQLQLLKAKHPHLRTLIAVGGSTWSSGFSAAAASDSSRQRFAQSCADFVQRYGFDGIDIDWEYPVGGGQAAGRPEDEVNATLLLRELRRELDLRGAAAGRRYLLSAATPAAAWSLDHFEIAKVAAVVDFLNVMTYDFHGSWEDRTGFNSPIRAAPGDPTPQFTVAGALSLYRARGVSPAKLNLGIPFYGRGWSGVGSTNDGLFQAATGPVPMGTSEPGMWDYRDLAQDHVGRMRRHWSEPASVPFLYDPATRTFITYDDPTSVRAKASYARANGLGGVMMWDLGADDDQHRLLVAATTP